MTKKVTKTAANRTQKAGKKSAKLTTLPPKSVGGKEAQALKGGAVAGPWGVEAPEMPNRTLNASTLKIIADRSTSRG